MEYTVSPMVFSDSFLSNHKIKIVGDNIHGRKESYYLRVGIGGIQTTFESDAEVDYKEILLGDAFFNSSKGFSTIDFDVNENGELVIIGADADRFYIDENGNLIFRDITDYYAGVGLESYGEDSDMIVGLQSQGESNKLIQLKDEN